MTKLLLAPDGVAKVAVHGTPSDNHALRNAITIMRRHGFRWPRREGAEVRHTVRVEARSVQVSPEGDLCDRILTILEGDARVAGPAAGENLKQGTVGVVVTIQGETDPVQAVGRAVAAFVDALRQATGEDAEVVEIEATQEREDAAALA